ncbi:hypothetical protein SAMN04487914_13823 [Arthrobacter sp. ok909]|uniref:hypothetical protein n=1 Tax=Arthrobacter sp. ok909 TaxID=1761746 RepID=UPI00088F162D|nr:hypothetical protein [Arthrobacter sp. ok909]SDP77801.1 hypothetical protein SAMN04487914_13823 [Arthrobacter sp. ok909]
MNTLSGVLHAYRPFFPGDVLDVAPEPPGYVLHREDGDGTVSIRITEVAGERGPGAHACRGKSASRAGVVGDYPHDVPGTHAAGVAPVGGGSRPSTANRFHETRPEATISAQARGLPLEVMEVMA